MVYWVKNNTMNMGEINNNDLSKEDNSQDEDIAWMHTWMKGNNEYCNYGDRIGVIEYKVNNISNYRTLYADKNGILIRKNTRVKRSDDIFSEFFEIKNDKSLYNIPIYKNDLFNKSESLKWERVGASNVVEEKLRGFVLTQSESYERVFCTLNNIDGYDYIKLS